jgi:hypothetical protein
LLTREKPKTVNEGSEVQHALHTIARARLRYARPGRLSPDQGGLIMWVSAAAPRPCEVRGDDVHMKTNKVSIAFV